MIFPTKVVRGLEERGPVHVHVFSSGDIGATAKPYGVGGIKTGSLFVAGLVTLTVYYVITGAGQTTLKAIPMDENDAQELPMQSVLGTAIASGEGFVTVSISLVCISLKLQVLSTSNNVITALIFGRTA